MGHIFEAFTKPKPSYLLMGASDSQVHVPSIAKSANSKPHVHGQRVIVKLIFIQMYGDLLTLNLIPLMPYSFLL